MKDDDFGGGLCAPCEFCRKARWWALGALICAAAVWVLW